MNKTACLLFSLGTLAAANAMADKVPVAGQAFLINATAITSLYSTTVTTVAKDGSFVVAWVAPEGSDTSPNLYVRRFAANGSPLTQDIRVNTSSTTEVSPEVVTDAHGNFALAWMTNVQTSTSDLGTIKLRLFQANGTPVGDEFCVDAACSVSATGYSLAMDDAGDFAVVRDLSSSTGPSSAPSVTSTVDAIRFSASGAPKDPSPIAVANLTVPEGLTTAAVRSGLAAMNPTTGELAVSWNVDSGLALGGFQLLNLSTNVRRFGAADGKPVGLPANIQSCTGVYEIGSVALGGFAGCVGISSGPFRYTSQGITASWVEDFVPQFGTQTLDLSIHSKSISPLGIAFGHFVLASSSAVDSLRTFSYAAALDADGTLIMEWRASPSNVLMSQAFNAAGWPLGDPFPVSGNSNSGNSVAANQGVILYTWSQNILGTYNENLYGQLYNAN
ncbi:MAG: hypothetical protein P4L83_00320 [Nevskia sp.]|nr:hypothetical protein [Nevskia sp.]